MSMSSVEDVFTKIVGNRFENSCEKWGEDMQLNVGDSVGQINKTSSGEWKLYEDKINKLL